MSKEWARLTCWSSFGPSREAAQSPGRGLSLAWPASWPGLTCFLACFLTIFLNMGWAWLTRPVLPPLGSNPQPVPLCHDRKSDTTTLMPRRVLEGWVQYQGTGCEVLGSMCLSILFVSLSGIIVINTWHISIIASLARND